MAENAPKISGRRFTMLQAVLQQGMGDNPAKFEEAWKTWEHQVDVYEKLATSKLDDTVKLVWCCAKHQLNSETTFW